MRRLVVFAALSVAATAAGQGKESYQYSFDTELTAMALDPTDRSSMVGFVNGGVVVFPVLEGKFQQLIPFPGHQKAVTAAVFLPNGQRVATASRDGTLKVWDVKACRDVLQFLQASNGTAKPTAPKPWLSVQAHPGGVNSLAVRPDGTQILSAGADGSVKEWDVKTAKVTLAVRAAHPGGVTAALYRPDAAQIVTAGADRTLKVWDAKKGTLVGKSAPLPGAVHGLALSPDGKKAAVACGPAKKGGPGLIVLLDLDTRKVDSSIEAHDAAATCVVFHPKNPFLATGGADRAIRVWDLGTRERVTTVENADPVRGLAIIPDGKRFAAFSASRLRWWKGFGPAK